MTGRIIMSQIITFSADKAFANDLEYMDGVKIGVLAGSLLSPLFGYFLLLLFYFIYNALF